MILRFAKGGPAGSPFLLGGSCFADFPGALPCRRGIFGSVDSGTWMADTVDDLSAPLGQKTEQRKRAGSGCRSTALQALAGLLGLFLLGFVGFALFNDNPLGGEPVAQVAIRQNAAGEKGAADECVRP